MIESFKMVALEEIDCDPSSFPLDKSILRSLTKPGIGQIQNIVLAEKPGEKFQLVAGRRRIRAAYEAKIPALVAKILPAEVDQGPCLLVENLARSRNQAAELSSLLEIIERVGIETAMQESGLGKRQLLTLTRLLGLDRATLEAFFANKINSGCAGVLATLDKQQQRQFLEAGFSTRADAVAFRRTRRLQQLELQLIEEGIEI
jgi:ParB-like chromosome segregation protein Spo0J